MTIAQTHTEAISNPSMTTLTTIWAAQNRPKIDRSEELSGSTDCATSTEFMANPLGCPAPYDKGRGGTRSRTGRHGSQQRLKSAAKHTRNLSKLGHPSGRRPHTSLPGVNTALALAALRAHSSIGPRLQRDP